MPLPHIVCRLLPWCSVPRSWATMPRSRASSSTGRRSPGCLSTLEVRSTHTPITACRTHALLGCSLSLNHDRRSGYLLPLRSSKVLPHWQPVRTTRLRHAYRYLLSCARALCTSKTIAARPPGPPPAPLRFLHPSPLPCPPAAGPGIPPGVVTDWQGNMVDVAATVMHLSGAGVPAIADGTPIPLAQLLPDYVNPYDSTDGGDGDGSGDLGEGSVGLDLGVGPTEGGFQGTGQGVEPGAEAAAAPPGAAEGGSRRRLQLLVEGKRGKVQQQGRRRARERGQEPGGGGVGLLQSRPLVIEEGFEGPDLLEYDEQGRLVVEAAAERDPVEPGGGIDMGVDGRGVAGVGPGAGAAAGGAGRYGLNSTAAAEAVVQRRRLLVGAYDGGFNRGTREM